MVLDRDPRTGLRCIPGSKKSLDPIFQAAKGAAKDSPPGPTLALGSTFR